MNALQLVPKPITVTTRLTARMLVSCTSVAQLAHTASKIHSKDVEAACLSLLKAGVPYTELEILQSKTSARFSLYETFATSIVRSRQ